MTMKWTAERVYLASIAVALVTTVALLVTVATAYYYNGGY